MSDLPNGWAETKIGDLCSLVNGRAFKPSDWTLSGLPIVRIQNLNRSDAKFNFFDRIVNDKFLVETGDLLFAWSGTPGTSFGAHIWNGPRAILNQHIFNVRYKGQLVDKSFFRYAINQTLDEQIAKAHGGVGLRHVTKGMFEDTVIALPPLPEQKRVVAKIDSLSAKSKRARDRLDHIPRLVEQYKQAILTAGFRGRLTEEWRSVHHVDNDWFSSRLEDLIDDGPSNGWSPKSGPDATGALTLKLTATTSGCLRLDDSAVKRIYQTPEASSKYWLQPGDLLVQRSNTIEYVGAAAIFDGPANTYIYPDLMMRIRIRDEINRRYIWRYLNSEPGRRYLQERATGTAGNMPKINSETLRSLPVPLPKAFEERREIVRRIENAFPWIDRLAHEATSARKLIDHLDQAVLAKAFRGELVPQDPNDEPASVLLDRIKAQQQTKAPRDRKTRRATGPRTEHRADP